MIPAASTGQPEPAPGRRPARLPLPQSSFVGREPELAELAGLLVRSRLVTLTGPGGTGKTRLAIEAGRRGASGKGDEAGDTRTAVFVPLGSVRPPQSAASALASGLGLHDKPGASPAQTLLIGLRDLDTPALLLLIDGAEHNHDEVAGLAGTLLAAVPGLRILVTSRVVLGLPGEVCWAVPPPDCPPVAADAADIAASDAVRLFLARATERLPVSRSPTRSRTRLVSYAGGWAAAAGDRADRGLGRHAVVRGDRAAAGGVTRLRSRPAVLADAGSVTCCGRVMTCSCRTSRRHCGCSASSPTRSPSRTPGRYWA
jgi:hypothetical protein